MLLNNKYGYNPKTDLLGTGGFGRVYKARDTLLERDVALKMVNIEGTKAHYNLIEEIKRVYDFSHPNIIRYLDVFELVTPTATGEEIKTQVGVMEYIPDGDISQLDWNNLGSEKQKDIILQILDGLDYLHQNRIIHRDIKPSNILIKDQDTRPVPKITDFGISKTQDQGSVSVSRVIGSIPYMAPEQFDSHGKVSYNTDFWSLGILVYHLFTGNLPFGDESTTSEGVIMKKIMEMPLPGEVQQIPMPFRRLVEMCLVKDRNQRVKEASALKEVLLATTSTESPFAEKTGEKERREEKEDKARGSSYFGIPKEKTKVYSQKESSREPAIRQKGNGKVGSPASLGNTTKNFDTVKPTGNHSRITVYLIIGSITLLIFILVFMFQQRAPESKELVHILNMEMVAVTGGTFLMGCPSEQGSDCWDNEKPAHQVTLSDFLIGKYPVTQHQWRAVMGNNPSVFSGCNDCPVDNVSWYDVKEFISKLNQATGKKYRLPTEAEWEYAARGGQKSRGYRYAGSNNIGDVAWYGENSINRTHPVGSKQSNELAIYDMSGNVWEWCYDFYGHYTLGAKQNPTGPYRGSSRVLRGGSWGGYSFRCRVWSRSNGTAGHRSYYTGFRLALSP